MAETKFSCFWRRPDLSRAARAAVSLHGHTNRSKESLQFIPQLAQKGPLLHEALEKQCRKSRIPVDFSRAYWTPPLTPKLAYETEKDQIKNGLGLEAMVSLTDHDNIEAPVLLRTMPDIRHAPISVEWSVPFAGTVFHLGVHNLPSRSAQTIMDDLAAYTRRPSDRRLGELLALLNEFTGVLLVFNHPLWTQTCIGVQRGSDDLDRFLSCAVRFLHAFEINAARSAKENNRVKELAAQWRRPLVSGGDRHGCEASGALNLTSAETFCEFVSEIRQEQRSHVLLMPQYTEPLSIRTTRTLLDVIRNYPEYPVGSRRWDDRVFHPDQNGGPDRPISELWKVAPAFLERILSCIRLLESVVVQRAVKRAFRPAVASEIPAEILAEGDSPEVVPTEAVSSEALS
jgi:hypothetical protein